MQILIEVPESKRAGITHARHLRNASLPTHVQDGEQEDGTPIMVPNPELIDSDEAYLTWVIGKAVDSYVAAVPPAPTPPPSPDPVNGVPQAMTRKQGLKALARANTIGMSSPIFEADVLAAINAMPEATPEQLLLKNDTLIEFKDAATWRRQNPYFLAMASTFGATEEQKDALFQLGVTFTD